jgi:hypothetical protein
MFTFVANLKPFTFRPGRGGRRFRSYLLSVEYRRELADLARAVTRGGRALVADNGNVSRIRALIARFEPDAVELDALRKAEEAALGRYARPGDLSPALTARYRTLADRIRDAAREAVDTAVTASAVEAQRAMDPTYLIGMEDLTMPVLTSLSIEPEYAGLSAAWYRSLTDRAVELAVRTRDGEFGAGPSLIFAGLHGANYDTALAAGAAAGAEHLDGIASGLVGAMKDLNAVDYRIQEGQVIPLGRTAARPYLRVLEIASGLHVGYAEATGRRPRFHALGAGSPILIPLLALLGDKNSYTAADSTAPILDAWSSKTISLYVKDPAIVKLKAHRIVEFWLADGKGWTCRCPYCAAFGRRHPPDLARARDWWRANGSPQLEAEHVLAPSPLAEWIPLLANVADPVIRAEAGRARTGHNHWVVQRLEAKARAAARDPSKLRAWAADAIDTYLRYENASPLWQASARAAWELADQTAERLQGVAASGGLPGPPC